MESTRRPRRKLWFASAGIASVIVIASVVTLPPRSTGNQSILSGAHVDGRVLGLLQRSCQDCHSEATRYPWYSYVAPVSWLVRNDVIRGRAHMNLSKWNDYSLIRKERCLSEIANQVKDRDMPLRQYTWIHRDARLSDSDVNAIFQWTQTERDRLITESYASR